MSRIPSVFTRPEHKALIAYLTVGYPTPDSTLELVPLLAEAGCDIIELGIPFSDPLADGTTIQEASHRALQEGVTPQSCLKLAAKLSKRVEIPLIFMTYYNPILHYGVEPFCRACAEAGVDGLIIPDLPPDEGGKLEVPARKHKLDLIYLIAPTATEERIRLVAEKSSGFIYLVSLTGVTGPRETMPPGLGSFVARVKKQATQPLCVGFGISNAEQAHKIAKLANGVIVGSRLLQLIRDDNPSYQHTRTFIRSLREALDK